MNIKESREFKFTNPFNFDYIGSDVSSNKILVMASTIGALTVGAIITVIVSTLSGGSTAFQDLMMIVTAIVTGFVVFLAMFSLIFMSDWHRDGMKMWKRIMFFNVVIMVGTLGLYGSITEERVVESVNKISIKKTSISDCSTKIIFKSENMNYTSCDDGSFYRIVKDKVDSVNIIGYYKYGEIVRGNIEILEEEITLE